jgi:hypothetical protein
MYLSYNYSQKYNIRNNSNRSVEQKFMRQKIRLRKICLELLL